MLFLTNLGEKNFLVYFETFYDNYSKKKKKKFFSKVIKNKLYDIFDDFKKKNFFF